MYSKILEQIHTTYDVQTVQAEVADLRSAAFKNKKNSFEEALKTKVRANIAQAITDELKESGQAFDQYVDGLVAELQKVEVAYLSLAFEPTLAFLEKIHSSIQEMVTNAHVALEITYQPQIIGGMILTFRGKYFDYSLQKKFVEESAKILGAS